MLYEPTKFQSSSSYPASKIFQIFFSTGNNSTRGDSLDKKKHGQAFFHEQSIHEISRRAFTITKNIRARCFLMMIPYISFKTLAFNQDNMSVLFIPTYTPLLYSKIGVYRGIHYFLIFAQKHRFWVLVRTV